MKSFLLALLTGGMALTATAQTDTTTPEKADTIKVGGMIIIKRPGKDSTGRDTKIVVRNRTKPHSNVKTNWWIMDLGFSNFSDNTNYAAAAASGFVGPGVGEDQLQLREGKSVNVNIWVFMQRLNVIKHVVNLKYGLGLELNNYRFENNNLLFQENPTRIVLAPSSAKAIKKNKLAADYLTVPMMLNFNFTPDRKNGFGFSAGVSAGYLYSSRQKLKDVDGGKTKTKDDFDLNKWKVSYIGELSLGPIRLYGSMATKNMWNKGLDQTPYNIGIRFSHL